MSNIILKKREPTIKIDEETNLTDLQKVILSNRANVDYLKEFNYTFKDLYNSKFDPVKNIKKLPDIEKAGYIIATAIKEGNHVLLASDMDADGVTSAAVLNITFRDVFKVNTNNYKSIVNRRLAGNGFNPEFVNRIKKIHDLWKVDLIITSDHGSADEQAYKELKQYGIEQIIVTDHHTIPKDNYPKSADVVINPHRIDSTYYKDVSGCFVACIAMIETMKNLKGDYYLEQFEKVIPYVAISTISDVMNLSLPINRQVVKYGLRILNSLQSPTWIAIKKVLGIKNRINSKDIGFKLAPLINTANRVNQEDLAFNMLVEPDLTKAVEYATMLNKFNMKRKRVQKELLKQATMQRDTLPYENSIVVALKSIYAVNGIVAGNLGDHFSRPTVCFLYNDIDDTLTGSGRGILKSINLVKIYNNINSRDKTVMLKYGGHKLAAGCKIPKDKLEVFRKMFDEEASKMMKDYKDSSVIYYDKEISSNDISPIIFKDQNRLLPYGSGWDSPVYISKLKIGSIMLLGKTLAKIKFIASDNTEIESTHFFNNKNSKYTIDNIKDLLHYGDKITLVYNLGLNSFNDVISFEINVIDIIKE